MEDKKPYTPPATEVWEMCPQEGILAVSGYADPMFNGFGGESKW